MRTIVRVSRFAMCLSALTVATAAGLEAQVRGQAPSQAGGVLRAGTVTANVDTIEFSANVSIASFANGKLVLSNLSNAVQLQVPNAKVGRFELKLNADGGLVDQILSLKVGNRYITPVSGWIAIESLTATSAAGRFEFAGKDLATEAPVKVSDGRFDVKFTGK